VGKSIEFENELLQHVFNNTDIANIGDATGLRGSPGAGSLYVSLHTADPTAGDQTTSEAAYTGYARVAVARIGGAWVVTSSSVSPAVGVTFPAGTGGGETVTHFGVGARSSGAGLLLYSGMVTVNIPTGDGVTPVLTTASTVTES
jgi:hypothetical protein